MFLRYPAFLSGFTLTVLRLALAVSTVLFWVTMRPFCVIARPFYVTARLFCFISAHF